MAVNVVIKDGELILGLTAANFRGEFRGQPVKILSAEWDARPRRIVLLLDASASMVQGRQRAKWNTAVHAVDDMLSFTRVQDRFGVIVFASRMEVTLGFVHSRAALWEQLKSIAEKGEPYGKGGGRTALFAAIREALSLIGPDAVGSANLAVTDAGENASRIKQRVIEQELARTGVRFFVLLVVDPIAARIPETLWGPDMARKLTSSSGGRLVEMELLVDYTSGEGRQHLREALRDIHHQIAAFYVIEVELPSAVEKLRRWELDVVDAAGKPMNNVTLLYPRRLAPCAESGK